MLTRLALPRIPSTTHPIRLVLQRRQQLRLYSMTELNNGIKLAYDLHEPPKKEESEQQSSRENAPPIVFLHGLFGSKKNNRSMSKYAPFDNEILGAKKGADAVK